MAKISDKNRITNEEIEAIVDEFLRKLEILRVRYEQYFIGVEKVAPSVMRMDVVRIMRELEQIKVKNTALKFKIRQGIQKFTSYSTYWNRTLREIEDGTYKRHIDRAKRNQETNRSAAGQNAKTEAPVKENREASKAVADEAEAFLAGLGLAPSPAPRQTQTAQDTAEPQQRRRAPTITMSQPEDAQKAMLRKRRPTIVTSQTGEIAQPSPTQTQPIAQPAPTQTQPIAQPAPTQTQPIAQPAQQPAAVAAAQADSQKKLLRARKPSIVSSQISPAVQPPAAAPAQPAFAQPQYPTQQPAPQYSQRPAAAQTAQMPAAAQFPPRPAPAPMPQRPAPAPMPQRPAPAQTAQMPAAAQFPPRPPQVPQNPVIPQVPPRPGFAQIPQRAVPSQVPQQPAMTRPPASNYGNSSQLPNYPQPPYQK